MQTPLRPSQKQVYNDAMAFGWTQQSGRIHADFKMRPWPKLEIKTDEILIASPSAPIRAAELKVFTDAIDTLNDRCMLST